MQVFCLFLEYPILFKGKKTYRADEINKKG